MLKREYIVLVVLAALATVSALLTAGLVSPPPEIQLWLLQTIIYAILTGVIAPFAYKYISDIFEKRKLRRLEEKQALEKEKNLYEKCVWQIKQSIKRILKNEWSYYSDIGVSGLSPELEKKVEEYNKNYERCRDWFKACNITIKFESRARIRDKFPKTAQTYPALYECLLQDTIIDRYIKGEKVTSTWIKEDSPKIYINMMKELEQNKEDGELDTFFKEINIFFENEDILKRFRAEKKELIEYGNKITNELNAEIEILKQKLEKL